MDMGLIVTLLNVTSSQVVPCFPPTSATVHVTHLPKNGVTEGNNFFHCTKQKDKDE